MIDVERLKHDRDYWDDVGAPEDATHYDGGFGDYPSFMLHNNGTWSYWSRDHNGWCRHSGSGREKFIPRPARKQWSGPEDGLPPVGVECEYRCIGSSGQRGPWFVCTVKYVLDCDHDPDADGWQAVIWCPHLGKEQYATLDKFEFRPLKSEKERVVDFWSATIMEEDCDKACEVIANLYELGALKMPEGGQ